MNFIQLNSSSDEQLIQIFILIYTRDLYVAAVDSEDSGALLYYDKILNKLLLLDAIEVARVKYPRLIIYKGTGDIFSVFFNTLIVTLAS